MGTCVSKKVPTSSQIGYGPGCAGGGYSQQRPSEQAVIPKPPAPVTRHSPPQLPENLTDFDKDDYFERLPDEIIIDIFYRLNDSKFLVKCLLINKRIASLISHIRRVFIKIPPPDANASLYLLNRYYSILWHYELVGYDYNRIRSSSNEVEIATRWKLRRIRLAESFYICKALKKLRPFGYRVERVIIEYPKFDVTDLDRKMTRWVVDYSGGVNTGVIKSCGFLMQIADGNQFDMLISLLQSAFTFHPMVDQMAQDHKYLHDILVTTASRKGWMHAGKDAILKMRQPVVVVGGDDAMKMHMKVKVKVKVWYVPILKGAEEGSDFQFMVASSPDRFDQELKAVVNRFWGDSSYWSERHDEVIQMGIGRKMRELIETIPCNYECIWICRGK